MNLRLLHVVPMAVIVLCSMAAYAAEGDHEDLSACKLPNDITVIPAERSPEARKNGEVFSFSRNKLAPKPVMEGKKWTAKDLLAKILEAKAGDLMYSRAEQGVFLAASTRIADLGKHYLYEFDGKELTRPEVPYGKEERKETPGLIEGVSKLDGHCFLIETADGKVAIFRLLSSNDQNARIQWVYQSDGGRTFVIPKGAVIADKTVATDAHPTAVQSGLSISAIDMRDFEKAVGIHKANRQRVIGASIEILKSLEASVGLKYKACELLGDIRAAEAADILSSLIDTQASNTPVSSRITMRYSYGCVRSLIKIGIPGAVAAMRQIAVDIKSEPPKGGDLQLWNDRLDLRRDFLSLVVLKVYGEKLAKIVIEDKITESSDPKVKEAYQKALEAFPRIKNWLPEEKAATTMPSAATMPAK